MLSTLAMNQVTGNPAQQFMPLGEMLRLAGRPKLAAEGRDARSRSTRPLRRRTAISASRSTS
jgi:hypothetical protein